MFITLHLSNFGGCFVIQCGIWHAGVWGIDATTSVLLVLPLLHLRLVFKMIKNPERHFFFASKTKVHLIIFMKHADGCKRVYPRESLVVDLSTWRLR